MNGFQSRGCGIRSQDVGSTSAKKAANWSVGKIISNVRRVKRQRYCQGYRAAISIATRARLSQGTFFPLTLGPWTLGSTRSFWLHKRVPSPSDASTRWPGRLLSPGRPGQTERERSSGAAGGRDVALLPIHAPPALLFWG